MKYSFLKQLLFVSMLMSGIAVAQAQTHIISPGQMQQFAASMANEMMNATFNGNITSEDGKPVADANILLMGSDGFVNVIVGNSNKSGKYSLRAMSGSYTVEITFPGCVKQVAKIDLPKDGEKTLDIVLTPKLNVTPAKGGNDIMGSGDSYTMTLGKNIYYKDKSLLDVLDDAPMVYLRDVPATLAGEEEFEIYVNSQIVKVAPKALQKYFSATPASDVKTIKVARGNVFQKYPPKLYITLKQ